jgi:porphobilinogen synthase
MIAPSDMMDGRVRAIRNALDARGDVALPIMSYSTKYSSSFYGPFREAAQSAPAFGDRKTYQMDYHNKKEGVREALQDIEEGADIVMVKPALAYLDVINEVARAVDVPLAAYSVSGEYAMIKAAARAGYVDEASMACETAVGIFRAGADLLITYYAMELARWIQEGRIG